MGHHFARYEIDRRRGPALALVTGLILALLVVAPRPAAASLCPDVPHTPDPVDLDCASQNERWAVVDPSSGLVTNVVGWTGTNRWRPPPGQIAIDLPDGSPVGPGWWLVGGEFVRDAFERNMSARADILSVHLSWSTGGLGADLAGVTYTVTIQPGGRTVTLGGWETSLTLDPLPADVVHTFAIVAALPGGRTVAGPTVSATPKPDPDPGCIDHRVARECRAATNWAVVHPDTGMVENAIVCTPWQCGTDGAWGGRLPSDTPWPGYLLIELTGSAGIGWKYVEGTFVDVRPREELFAVTPSAPTAPTRGSGPSAGNGGATGSGTSDDGATDTAAPSPDSVTENDMDDTGDPDVTWLDDGVTDEDTGTPDADADGADASGPDGSSVNSESSVSAGSSTAGVTAASGLEPREGGAVRRVIEAVVTFFTSLFRR